MLQAPSEGISRFSSTRLLFPRVSAHLCPLETQHKPPAPPSAEQTSSLWRAAAVLAPLD